MPEAVRFEAGLPAQKAKDERTSQLDEERALVNKPEDTQIQTRVKLQNNSNSVALQIKL